VILQTFCSCKVSVENILETVGVTRFDVFVFITSISLVEHLGASVSYQATRQLFVHPVFKGALISLAFKNSFRVYFSGLSPKRNYDVIIQQNWWSIPNCICKVSSCLKGSNKRRAYHLHWSSSVRTVFKLAQKVLHLGTRLKTHLLTWLGEWRIAFREDCNFFFSV
jgi:hypothetical protein